MRLRHRHDVDDTYTDDDLRDYAVADDADREDLVDTRTSRWDLGSVLAIAAGAVLIVIGAVALARTGVDATWYRPVEQVLGTDHTPLLGAAEIGAGALLVLAALAGARMFAALVALVVAVGATVVAVEPETVDRELAMEQDFAVAVAIAGYVLALVLVVARERRHDRRIVRRTVRTA